MPDTFTTTGKVAVLPLEVDPTIPTDWTVPVSAVPVVVLVDPEPDEEDPDEDDPEPPDVPPNPLPPPKPEPPPNPGKPPRELLDELLDVEMLTCAL